MLTTEPGGWACALMTTATTVSSDWYDNDRADVTSRHLLFRLDIRHYFACS